jgi:hypothetical protein
MTKQEDGAEKLRGSIYEVIGQMGTMIAMLDVAIGLARSELQENTDEYLKFNSYVQELVKKLRATADRLT